MSHTALASKEDVKIIMMVLSELTRRFELDKSIFAYDISRRSNERDDDQSFPHQVRESLSSWCTDITISMRPERNSQSSQQEISYVHATWIPQTGLYSVSMGYSVPAPPGRNMLRESRDYEAQFYLGMGNKTLDGKYACIKKTHINLMKKIKEYVNVETPKRNNERFASAVYETFPSLLDEILMENNGDEEKS